MCLDEHASRPPPRDAKWAFASTPVPTQESFRIRQLFLFSEHEGCLEEGTSCRPSLQPRKLSRFGGVLFFWKIAGLASEREHALGLYGIFRKSPVLANDPVAPRNAYLTVMINYYHQRARSTMKAEVMRISPLHDRTAFGAGRIS
jgi:hypothetical protein